MKQYSIISKSEFLLGVVDKGQFPQLDLPEVAFVGRSNVGKSSLINSIVLRKNLARTSSTPGKTREINFFMVEDR
jgi:GTP-binding protein